MGACACVTDRRLNGGQPAGRALWPGRTAPRPGPAPRGLPLTVHPLVSAVVDHYTSTIVFNGVRVIAIVIIGLGFLLLLLPEEWDAWLVKLLTRLKARRKEEPAEGAGDAGSGPQKSRRARPSFAR